MNPSPDREMYDRYLPIVRRIAMRTVRRLPPSITIDDVIGAGWVGMVEAMGRRTETMDEEQFEAFASYRIRGSILDYLRALDPMSRKLRGASRKVSKVIGDLVGELGRAPEQDEIAHALGISIEEYHDLLTKIGDAGWARLDIGDVEPASEDASPENVASRRELTGAVQEAIGDLPERVQLVLGLYYQEDCSFRQIGEVLGVTESRVCQIHTEAMHRIRAIIEGDRTKKKRTRAA